MTVTEIRPAVVPVVVTTLDGESREAYTCPDGSWSCPFCSGANFPAGHEHHRDYGWAGPCSNPACLVGGAMTEQATARIREDQRRREEREAQHKRWQDEREREEAARKAAAEALEAKRKRGIEQAAAGRLSAVQLGFAWSCVKDECEVSGNDRAEFTEHAKSHGLKAPRPVKPIRLRKTAPAASLPKLEVSAFKWLRWTETHTTPGTCTCGHGTSLHQARHGNDGDVHALHRMRAAARWPGALPKPVTQEAERRGQFWAVGTHLTACGYCRSMRRHGRMAGRLPCWCTRVSLGARSRMPTRPSTTGVRPAGHGAPRVHHLVTCHGLSVQRRGTASFVPLHTLPVSHVLHVVHQ